jgi:transposase
MPHIVVGIDVHKKLLAVVLADAAEGELRFHRRMFGAGDGELRRLSTWLSETGAQEVVMESTAQYWKPVWRALEGQCQLALAQAQSNKARRGRKSDYRDAERLVRRYLADELVLSFVPDREQQLWRTLARSKVRWTRDRSRLQNRLEALLEEMGIKLSSVVSDLLGVSGTRILRAIADGAQDCAALAGLAEPTLRATAEQLCDVLRAASDVHPRYRLVLRQLLAQVDLASQHIAELDRELAGALEAHAAAVQRLAAIPGIGVDAAQQIIAEVGPAAERFASAEQLCSWVGSCPGEQESAGESHSDRSPKGNKPMRRILNQAANAAVKVKGSVFQARYCRMMARDPKAHPVAIWAVANHICRVVWVLLRRGLLYEERGARPDPRVAHRRAHRLLRQLSRLGYKVTLETAPMRT